MSVEFGLTNTTNVITVNSASNINNMGALTVAYWAKVRNLGGGSQGRAWDKTGSGTGKLNILASGQTIMRLSIGHTTTTLIIESTAGYVDTSGAWNHYIVTWDGTTTASNSPFYKNGVKQTVYQLQQNGVGAVQSDSTKNLLIGNVASASRNANADFSEFAVWNVQLSDDEALKLGNSKVRYTPLQIRPSSLVRYFPLDDFTDGAVMSGADSVRDRSASNTGATPTNSPIGRADENVSYP